MTRLLSTLMILIAIFIGSRALIRALPGDPIETLVAESGTTIPSDVLREELGLDRPFSAALVEDLKNFSRGDLGVSLLSKKPVAPILRARFAKTLALAFLSMALGLAISIPLGLIAAARPGGLADRICTFHGAVMAALPTPWIGPMLMILLAVQIPLFPIGGHIALPALTLALGISGLWSRLVRDRVQETIRHGSVPGARARGLSEPRVMIKYALAPVGGALLAYLGTSFGGLLAGAFVTEVIFDWRGIGSLLVESVLKRDYPIIEAAVFVTASASLFGTVIGDWLQSRLDPRVRETE